MLFEVSLATYNERENEQIVDGLSSLFFYTIKGHPLKHLYIDIEIEENWTDSQ